jgi:protein-tyrosine phosphatase
MKENRLRALVLLLFLAACSAYGDSNEQAASVAAPTPGPNMGIASVPNLRDLGGYATEEGDVVSLGLVYRANQLSGITPEDMARLEELGLATAYDLRTAEEIEKRPDELPEGTTYVWLDVLADSPHAGPAQLEKLMSDPTVANEELGGGKIEQLFQGSYREFVSLPSAQREFARLFTELGDKDKLPAVFHCTTGKDRTGWATAAFLTLMGVPRDTVFEDYLRSNDYIIPKYQPAIDAFVQAGGEESIPHAILGVKREYLEAAFDEMAKTYGTIDNYFAEALGIDAGQQQALREMYLGKNVGQ